MFAFDNHPFVLNDSLAKNPKQGKEGRWHEKSPWYNLVLMFIITAVLTGILSGI